MKIFFLILYIYFVIRFVLIMEYTINLKVLKPFAKAFQTVLNFALDVCDILKKCIFVCLFKNTVKNEK